jgi:hypothetical protein
VSRAGDHHRQGQQIPANCIEHESQGFERDGAKQGGVARFCEHHRCGAAVPLVEEQAIAAVAIDRRT